MILNADPHATYLAHKQEIDEAIQRVLSSGWYILGKECDSFEEEFARYVGVKCGIGVANGTDALELALRAVGVRAGDQVVTVANTATATAAAISSIGATPVFVDIERDTMLIDTGKVEDVLAADTGRKIKAVVPVHLYGMVADMPTLLRLCEAHGAVVIEDCAQAHGASLNGKRAGSWGRAAAFSFYPTKNLGALGDGGAVVTDDEAVSEKVRSLRQYGWKQRYVSDVQGRNSRLDEMQAAILRVKLSYLETDNSRRRFLADRYLSTLRGTGIVLPMVPAGVLPVWHQFVVRAQTRDRIKDLLGAKGIGCGVLYPVSIHRQPGYLRPDVELPQTDRACDEVLSLPVHAGLKDADVDTVCRHILAGWSS